MGGPSAPGQCGGRTVYTRAQTSIRPLKNSAVFWYNLKRSGSGDVMTEHGGCPVLSGDKWVANWWIMERGQMSRRPCALDRLR